MKKKIFITIFAIGLIYFSNILADEMGSAGGFFYGSKGSPYWFKLGGVLKLDQRYFKGNYKNKGNEFHGGGNIRDVGLTVDGGLGNQLSYTLGFAYDAKESKVNIEDAYLTYSGFGENFTASIGQVNPGFCVESTSSSKWTPFLERSMPTVAFSACPGLGVSINKWDKNYSFIMSITQPKIGYKAKDVNGNETTTKKSDHWQTTARLTYAPYIEGNRIIQLGLSGHYKDNGTDTIRFKTPPEAKARNITEVIDTGYFISKNQKTVDFELSIQNGPLYGEIEYQKAFAKRDADLPSVKFHGYHVQAAYVLTGEARTFKASNGTFGQVKPATEGGAWEIAARHSFINLNDKRLQGGSGRNTSFGVNYYLNNNIRISGEYTYSIQHPSQMPLPKITLSNKDKRKLHIVGLRVQAVF